MKLPNLRDTVSKSTSLMGLNIDLLVVEIVHLVFSVVMDVLGEFRRDRDTNSCEVSK
jgi:hypothetical protein